MLISTTAIEIYDTWQALGVTMPADVEKAVSSLGSINSAFPPAGAIPNIEITDGNVQDILTEYALAQVVATKPPNGWAPFTDARTVFSKRYNDKAVRALADSVGDAVEQVKPAFAKAASAYLDAVARVPEGITHDRIIASGDTEALTALKQAEEAAAALLQFEAFVDRLGDLPATPATDRDFLLIAPQTEAELQAVAEIDYAAFTEEEKALELRWLIAARNGIAFELLTPQEAEARRADLVGDAA